MSIAKFLKSVSPDWAREAEQRLAALEATANLLSVNHGRRVTDLEAKVAEPHERLGALEKYNEGNVAWHQKVIIALAKQRAVNEALLVWVETMDPGQGALNEALREALKS